MRKGVVGREHKVWCVYGRIGHKMDEKRGVVVRF